MHKKQKKKIFATTDDILDISLRVKHCFVHNKLKNKIH